MDQLASGSGAGAQPYRNKEIERFRTATVVKDTHRVKFYMVKKRTIQWQG